MSTITTEKIQGGQTPDYSGLMEQIKHNVEHMKSRGFDVTPSELIIRNKRELLFIRRLRHLLAEEQAKGIDLWIVPPKNNN